MEPVTVQFFKNPDTLHWGFRGFLLGADEFGRWVGLAKGSSRWKGEVQWGPTGEDAVQCFPHDGWWVLHYNGPARPVTHFVDITTQPIWRDGYVAMIDLDLDLVVNSDGTVEVEDEDEFEAHQVELEYPVEMIERARAETDRVAGCLRRGEEPFFEVADGWLRKVSRQQT